MSKENSEVLMMYGLHDPEDAGTLDNLRLELEKRLMNPSLSKVYQLTEIASVPESLALNVNQEVEAGCDPIESFHKYLFYRNENTFPDPAELEQFTDSLMSNPLNKFKAKELIIASDLAGKYNSNGQKRFGILIAGIPDYKIEEVERFARDDKKREKLTFRFIREGNFDAAMKHFRSWVNDLVRLTPIADETTIELIKSKLRDNNVAIVGRFGEGHTRISHLLKKQGFNSHFIPVNKVQGEDYYFSPSGILIRKIKYFGEASIGELDYYKTMVGESLLKLLIAVAQVNGDETELSKTRKIVLEALTVFENMDDIRRFENEIRLKGFFMALKDF